MHMLSPRAPGHQTSSAPPRPPQRSPAPAPPARPRGSGPQACASSLGPRTHGHAEDAKHYKYIIRGVATNPIKLTKAHATLHDSSMSDSLSQAMQRTLHRAVHACCIAPGGTAVASPRPMSLSLKSCPWICASVASVMPCAAAQSLCARHAQPRSVSQRTPKETLGHKQAGTAWGGWSTMPVGNHGGSKLASLIGSGLSPGAQARGAGCRSSRRALCAACPAAKSCYIPCVCTSMALLLHKRYAISIAPVEACAWRPSAHSNERAQGVEQTSSIVMQ